MGHAKIGIQKPPDDWPMLKCCEKGVWSQLISNSILVIFIFQSLANDATTYSTVVDSHWDVSGNVLKIFVFFWNDNGLKSSNIEMMFQW